MNWHSETGRLPATSYETDATLAPSCMVIRQCENNAVDENEKSGRKLRLLAAKERVEAVEVEQRRGRNSKKSRSGCLTCKRQKVKCEYNAVVRIGVDVKSCASN